MTSSKEDLRDLYRELVLDHARAPRHFGTNDAATFQADGINRLCGDKLRLYIQANGAAIGDIRFDGTGCAISIASASLLTETLIGMRPEEAVNYSQRLIDRLTRPQGTDDSFDPGPLRALDGVREYPSRVKCATLAWQTLISAMDGNEAPASTE